MYIALVTTALGSHAGPLERLYARLRAQHTVIVFKVGWNAASPAPGDGPLAAPLALTSTVPDEFNVERAAALVDALDGQFTFFSGNRAFDVVVYDFFALEGALVARRRGLPSICVLPCVAARDEPVAPPERLRALVGPDMSLAHASDAHYIPGSAPPIHLNRLSEAPGVYVALGTPARRSYEAFIAFGTVVPTNLLRQNVSAFDALLTALRLVFVELAEAGYVHALLALPGLNKHQGSIVQAYANEAPLIVTCSFALEAQRERLATVGVFVTHGGGASTEEALAADVPMWVVPFFGDQHYAARRVVAVQPGARAYLIDAPNAVDADRDMASDPPRRRVDGPADRPSLAALHPSDLVYGRNVDRLALQVYLGINLGVNDHRWRAVPRLINHLNDVLIDGRVHPLAVYGEWAAEVARAGLPVPTRESLSNQEDRQAHDMLHALCIHGLCWWAGRGRVHFIVGDLRPENGATRAELAACLEHPEWTHVHFWSATLQPLTREQAARALA